MDKPKKHRSQYATQADVARLAGVSRAAVGAALGMTDRIQVSEKTRAVVLEAARKLNYVPHDLASSTRRGRSGQIGIIWPASCSQIQPLRVAELSRQLTSLGYKLTLRELVAANLNPEEAWDQVLGARVEGVFIISSLRSISQAMQKRIINSPVPVISISGPRFPGVPLVGADAESAFYQMTKHLISTGRKRLVLLQVAHLRDFNARNEWKHSARKAGFLRAVREAGIEDQCETFVLPAEGGERGFESGARAFEKILKGHHVPEGIVCNNDNLAAGVLRAAAEHGVRVPEDLAVTGFDGEPWAAYGTTPITTAIQPHVEMATTAVDFFKQLLEGKYPEEELRLLPCDVVFRKSSEPVA